MSIILGVGGNALALYLAQRFVSGFIFSGGWQNYLVAAFVLAVLNWTLKPVLKLISFPLIVLTLGLFTLVINAIILWCLDYFFAFISSADFTSLFLAALIVALVNLVLGKKI